MLRDLYRRAFVERIQAIVSRLETLTAELTSLRAEIHHLRTEIAHLRAETDHLRTDVQVLQSKAGGIETAQHSLEQQVEIGNAVGWDSTALARRLATLEDRLDRAERA